MKKAEPVDPAKEAEILFPERQLVIDGDTVTVNEITFVQGMRIGNLVAPMIRDMAEMFSEDATADFTGVGDVFNRHMEVVTELLAMTTGRDREWIERLNDTDGQNLLMTFWSVNSGFFTRRLMMRCMELKRQAPASPPSSAH